MNENSNVLRFPYKDPGLAVITRFLDRVLVSGTFQKVEPPDELKGNPDELSREDLTFLFDYYLYRFDHIYETVARKIVKRELKPFEHEVIKRRLLAWVAD